MGGRGAFSGGKLLKYGWGTIGHIGDVKKLEKLEGSNNKLPEYSRSPNAKYTRFTKEGEFRQLRAYNENREPILDIEYGYHQNKLGFHVHYLNRDPSHKGKETEFIEPGNPLYEQYKEVLEGANHGK